MRAFGFFCEILKHPNIDVNAQDSWSTTALMRGTINGRINFVKELLKHDKINVNAVNEMATQPSSWPAPITMMIFIWT